MRKISLATSAISLVVGVVLMFAATPSWWFGAGLIGGGLASLAWTTRQQIISLVERLKQPREVAGFEIVPAELLAEVGCLLVLAGVTIAMLPDAALGDRPVAHDHTVHFFKAWQLEETFLSEGHLFGWSHRWFAGYPAQYLYPIGADLLVVAIHWLSLGLIGMSHAYAWAIWIFWFLGGYAVYRFGANVFGRWGGLLAGFLFMTDTAANRIGGWFFAMEWGVWPMSLSIVVAVWAMSRVPRLMEGDRWRDVAIFGALMAAALVTHPFMLIHFALALTVAVFAFWLAETDTHWLIGSGRLVLGWATGTLLAMVWVLPFMSVKDFMDPHFGGRWTNFYEMGHGLYRLDLLPGTWSMAIALGVIGMVALLWSRRFEHLLAGLLCMTFVVFGSTDFLASFNFLDVFSMFQRVHFKRFITLLKPYWMVAAAYGVVAIVRHTHRHAVTLWRERAESSEEGDGLQPFAKRWMRSFVIGFCLFPLLVPFGHAFGSNHLSRSIRSASERPYQHGRAKVAEWFNREYPDGEPFFRVGMKLGQHDHRFVDFGRRIPFPTYKMGYTPATSFKSRMETDSPKMLEALNVRYVVSTGGPPPGKFRTIKRFGGLNLYEFEDWQREPFEVIEGEGEVELTEFGRERVVLEAAEGASGRLRLNISNFSRWQAYRDGRELPIEETRVLDDRLTGFITVELEPGTYRFVFERGWPETFGWLLFLVGLLLAVGFALADTSTRVGGRVGGWLEAASERLQQFCRRHQKWLGIAGVFFAGSGVLFVGWMGWHWPALRSKGHSLAAETAEVHYDFGDRLRKASVHVDKAGGKKRCPEMFGYFVCGGASWKVVHQRMEDFGPALSMARCIWAHPLPQGSIEIQFEGVPTGEAIVGHYGVAESGTTDANAPATLEVGTDGVYRYTGEAAASQKLYAFRMPIEESRRDGSIDVTFRVSAKHTGRRHFCFNAQVVDLTDEGERRVEAAESEPAGSDSEASDSATGKTE